MTDATQTLFEFLPPEQLDALRRAKEHYFSLYDDASAEGDRVGTVRDLYGVWTALDGLYRTLTGESGRGPGSPARGSAVRTDGGARAISRVRSAERPEPFPEHSAGSGSPTQARRRILVLFSGGQGASEGYRRAGFETIDVDNDPGLHPPAGCSYIFANAFVYLRNCLASGLYRNGRPRWDAIHASPPCQRWTIAQNARKRAEDHPDLITPLRPLLEATGLPYVIENVPGAPLRDPVKLCGTAFALRHDGFELRRERLFETNWPLLGLPCAHELPAAHVMGHGPGAWFYKKYGRGYSYACQRAVMETPWAHWTEIGQMIPPAFTEYIGAQLRTHLDWAVAA